MLKVQDIYLDMCVLYQRIQELERSQPRQRTNLGFEHDTKTDLRAKETKIALREIRNLETDFIEAIAERDDPTHQIKTAIDALDNALYYAYEDKGRTKLDDLLKTARVALLTKYDARTTDEHLQMLKTDSYKTVLEFVNKLNNELAISDSVNDEENNANVNILIEIISDIIEFKFYKTYAQDKCNAATNLMSVYENNVISKILSAMPNAAN